MSVVENQIDFQNVTFVLINSIVAARRRAISDRVLYDPSRISAEQINSDNPSAKMPVRPTAYGKNIQEAVYQFPYQDNQSQLMFSEIQQFIGWSDNLGGHNKAQQGQFVKGNKTRREFESVMANANGRDQLKSIIYECQVFTPLKECLKNNVLEKQTPATMYSRELMVPVRVDPVLLRKASLQFKISDGLIPSEKLIAGEALDSAFQALAQTPGLSAEYNLGSMFSYLMKTQGADLAQFEKSQSQKAYEQAVGQWQQTCQVLMEQFTAAIKGADPNQIPTMMAEFQKSLPPQPKPQDYGYDPNAKQTSAPSNPAASVMSETSAILNPPPAQSATIPGATGAQ